MLKAQYLMMLNNMWNLSKYLQENIFDLGLFFLFSSLSYFKIHTNCFGTLTKFKASYLRILLFETLKCDRFKLILTKLQIKFLQHFSNLNTEKFKIERENDQKLR